MLCAWKMKLLNNFSIPLFLLDHNLVFLNSLAIFISIVESKLKAINCFQLDSTVDLKLISVREFCYQLLFCCANRFENNFVRADSLPNDFSTIKIMSVISSSWTVKSWLSFEKLLLKWIYDEKILFSLFFEVDEEEKVLVAICLVRLKLM